MSDVWKLIIEESKNLQCIFVCKEWEKYTKATKIYKRTKTAFILMNLMKNPYPECYSPTLFHFGENQIYYYYYDFKSSFFILDNDHNVLTFYAENEMISFILNNENTTIEFKKRKRNSFLLTMPIDDDLLIFLTTFNEMSKLLEDKIMYKAIHDEILKRNEKIKNRQESEAIMKKYQKKEERQNFHKKLNKLSWDSCIIN